MELEAEYKLDDLADSDNINDLLTEKQSGIVGRRVHAAYTADESSRQRWLEKSEEATKLALQVTEAKSSPWENAANVKFPLVTIASMQFAARAYPSLIKAPDLVKFRVQGKDDGTKAARAERISSHMSYQLLEEDEPWEEHMDKALLALPILGCVFKKSYYDKTKGHNCSTLVLPKDLVVHYYARSIEECERKTEILSLSPREIKERQLRGVFSEHDFTGASTPEPKPEDKRQGIQAPFDDKDRSRTLLEQHCFIDLDGDGYKEPYVVTIDKDSSKVLRIVSRFKKITTEQSVEIEELQKRIKALAEGIQQPEQPTQEDLAQLQQVEATINKMQAEVEMLSQQKPKVLKIEPVEHYTKYSFIPSPDGGFYDLGFGALLGPLNDSVNTLLNQLIDSGTLSNGNQGFIGKGSGLKGGKIRFKLNEFVKVNARGGNIRDAIVPLPVNPPSPVLFDLLSLLISYSERVGSVTDAMVGENPGQNTPAYNMSAMLEQGMQVFNGIFKRIYRSMRSEFRKLYELNAIYLDNESYFSYQDSDTKVLRLDYTSDPKDLIPAADPNAFSNQEKVKKAMMIAERAQQVPGYSPIAVERMWQSAMDLADREELYPMVEGENGQPQLAFPPQPDPDIEMQKAELQVKTLEVQGKQELGVGKLEVDMMGKAAKDADSPTLERLKIQLAEMEGKRRALTSIAVAEIQADSEEKKIEGQAKIANKRPAAK